MKMMMLKIMHLTHNPLYDHYYANGCELDHWQDVDFSKGDDWNDDQDDDDTNDDDKGDIHFDLDGPFG